MVFFLVQNEIVYPQLGAAKTLSKPLLVMLKSTFLAIIAKLRLKLARRFYRSCSQLGSFFLNQVVIFQCFKLLCIMCVLFWFHPVSILLKLWLILSVSFDLPVFNFLIAAIFSLHKIDGFFLSLSILLWLPLGFCYFLHICCCVSLIIFNNLSLWFKISRQIFHFIK